MPDNKSPWGSGSSGGNGGGKSPWGQGGQDRPRPKSPKPMDNPFEDLKRRFGGGGPRKPGSGKGGPMGRVGPFGLFVIVAALMLLFSCFYTVDQKEDALVFRFGKFSRSSAPGLNFKLPSPFESVVKREISSINQENIGGTDSASLMLTGDENIVDIDFTVLWRISNLHDFIINVDETDGAVRAVAESAMREIVGKNELEKIITTDRLKITIDVRDLMQVTLDEYEAGVEIVEVQLQKADPPQEGNVIEAFRDVVNAQQDAETLVNKATAYKNDIVPRARGEAVQIIQDAEAYKDKMIAESNGEAQRFKLILEEYKAAPRVTRYRMYLETMEEVYGPANKMILDGESGSGVVPYLPLDELRPRTQGGK
ncbi:MAG: FtsH protease activity modulator HflK [Hellea sp.]|nr:FtsH protease activity modulator HflK [Hellea sp.]